MGDDDDEWGKAVQEAEGPRGTNASMREVQRLVDGDVHLVHGEMEEHYGMEVDGPAPGEDFRFDEDKDDKEQMHRLWSIPSSTALYCQGRKYPLLCHHQTLHPRLLNPLQRRVRRNSSLLLFLRKRQRRIGPRRRSWSRRFLLCRLLSLVP